MSDDTAKKKRSYFKFFPFLAGGGIGFLSGVLFTFTFAVPGLMALDNRHHEREIRATRFQAHQCPVCQPQIRTMDEWKRIIEQERLKKSFTPLPLEDAR